MKRATREMFREIIEDALLQVQALLRPNIGWYTLGAAVGLVLLGVAAIGTVEPTLAAKQGKLWLPMALTLMCLCTLPHPRALGMLAYTWLALCLGLLVFVILPFVPREIVPRVNGSTAWIDFKVMRFQPSEMAKVAYVLSLAWYLRYRESHRSILGLLIPFVIMLVPVALILKEPDLGQSLMFAPTLFVVLIAAGAKLRHMGTLLGLGVAVIAINLALIFFAPASMQILEPYQQQRVKSMVSLAQGETRHVADGAYQQYKAMTLIGAGGMTGYGKERSTTVVTFNSLPEDHNDMIFAVIANRWGLAGAWGVMLLYLVLVGSMMLVAVRSKDPFARLACVGFAGLIFTQATINIAMCLGLMPITGITLPFVSYGGSSLLFSFAMIGFVLNFAARRPQKMARPSFEFDNADAIYQ